MPYYVVGHLLNNYLMDKRITKYCNPLVLQIIIIFEILYYNKYLSKITFFRSFVFDIFVSRICIFFSNTSI